MATPPSQKDPTTEHIPQAWQRARSVLRVAHTLLDLIFPPRCVRCGRVDTEWCEPCQAVVDAIPITRIRTRAGSIALVAATGVHQGELQRLVQALKYEDARALAQPLGKRMALRVSQEQLAIDGVAAVPLHAQRLRERGYNQSKLLAAQVAELLGKPDYSNYIRRDRNTRSQVGLSRKERLTNVEGAFFAAPVFIGKRILLVDDVFTTGATLQACAQTLVTGGATTVYAVTVTAAAPPNV